MTNEIAKVENQLTTISENENYAIVQDSEGKFKRKAKFKEFQSIVAENRADKIWLLNLLEGSEDTGNGLKEHVGKQLEITDIITRPYDKINEDSGVMEYGVLTYLITSDRIAYVTSSKNVYFTIMHTLEVFGAPSKSEPYLLKVMKEKGLNGDMIKIKLIG